MNENHECTWNTVKWETRNGIPVYEIRGLGELLIREGECKDCGRKLTEKYQKLGVYFKDSNEEAF